MRAIEAYSKDVFHNTPFRGFDFHILSFLVSNSPNNQSDFLKFHYSVYNCDNGLLSLQQSLTTIQQSAFKLSFKTVPQQDYKFQV